MACSKIARFAVALSLSVAWFQILAQGQSQTQTPVQAKGSGQGPQTHQRAFDDYVVRSSVVNSLSIPEASAAAYGIERAPNRAILNVTVLKKGSNLTETVPAKVEASAVNLAGSRRMIPMAETKANGWVSYTGTFTMAPREVLDFNITAQPAGTGKPLEMTYREQVWVDKK